MNRRDLAALVTVVVIAVPGLAVAQQATNQDPQVERTDAEAATDEATEGDTEAATEDPTEGDTEAATEDATEVETEVEASPELESGTARLSAEGDEEGLEADDEGHGELISTLARCLPSGRSLHGTGWTKGAILSQVASTGTFTAEDGTTTEVATPEDATALCDQVQAMADSAEDPERAKGRPSWAGSGKPAGDDTAAAEGDTESSEGDEPDRVDEERGGPPAHAPAKGRRGR